LAIGQDVSERVGHEKQLLDERAGINRQFFETC